MEIYILLGLLGVIIYLFATEILPVDIITLLMLLVLIGTGILSPGEAFEGFSNDIIIILASVFVIGGALRESGMLDTLSGKLAKLGGKKPQLLLPSMMSFVGGISAFMNNTTVTALFAGPTVAVAKKIKKSPSHLLMPLAFASILGGTCTLIGTSTNVAVSGYLESVGLEPVGLFEITPIGVLLLVAGIVYLWILGPWLLPDRGEESLTEEYKIREYLTEIVVLPGSPLIGQRSFESDLSILNFQILKMVRDDKEFAPTDREPIQEGDVLLVAGSVEDLVMVSKIEGIQIRGEMKFSEPDLEVEDIKIAEVLITPLSSLQGRTLMESNFRRFYGLAVLAIYRQGQTLYDRIGSIRLRVGDMLLVQGSGDSFERLSRGADLAVLEEIDRPVNHGRMGWVVLGGFILAIILSGVGLFPLSACLLATAVLAVLTRCITSEQAYSVIDWRMLILIGGMTALGKAMSSTGTSDFLAQGIVGVFEPVGAYGLLAGFMVLTVILTQPMSNAAAALVVLPVALEAALQMGVDQRSFGIGIMMAASMSLITPLEPSCLIVYGPGKYRFFDFMRVGGGLTAILLLITWLMVPILWPL